jgi:hypothetical protein
VVVADRDAVAALAVAAALVQLGGSAEEATAEVGGEAALGPELRAALERFAAGRPRPGRTAVT